jgi:hypothetical protein
VTDAGGLYRCVARLLFRETARQSFRARVPAAWARPVLRTSSYRFTSEDKVVATAGNTANSFKLLAKEGQRKADRDTVHAPHSDDFKDRVAVYKGFRRISAIFIAHVFVILVFLAWMFV